MRHDLSQTESSLPVQQSWQRSTAAGVSRELGAAPLVLNDDALCVAREKSDWLALAREVIAPQLDTVKDSGHVLTLFDAAGRMLNSAGDPFVLESLDDIHFIPGADWSEAATGTNGPGTALATGKPAHIVGADHFVTAYHPWHCAAVPVRGPAGDIVGVLDVSGPTARADARVLQMACMLGLTVEQALLARAYRRQTLVLARYAELSAKYPLEALVALDADGQVLQATGPAKARGLPARLKVPLMSGGVTVPPPQAPWLEGASVHAVHEDAGARIGACLVMREHRRTLRRASAAAPSTRYTFSDLVGAGLRETIALARSAATTSMPVLLLGESGVGKEMLAQSIHAASPRHDGPFIAVNCAALARELVESELFGYVGGAFSGARAEGAIGRFEAAHGGTLFLDEVGELPRPAQAALLRVLQEHVVTPVGSTETRPIDVRIISATNRRLDDAVKEGSFRLDLLHRLNVLQVSVPPLRDRLDDLPVLVAQLTSQLATEGLAFVLPDDVRAALAQHTWPGNVRELDNVLRRLAVIARDHSVQRSDLPFTPAASAASANAQVQHLLDVIHSARNMAEAAARLGVNRSTLYRQLERLGLKPRRTATPE